MFDAKLLIVSFVTKKHFFENIIKLRKVAEFKKSFEFIYEVLLPYKDELFYIPSENNEKIIVEIFAEQSEIISFTGTKEIAQLIKSIQVNNKNITNSISKLCQTGTNSLNLKKQLKNFLVAPEELIEIIENIEIKRILFENNKSDNIFDF